MRVLSKKLFPKIKFILGNNAVESEGFEPSSKRVLLQPSTCLVFVYIFEQLPAKNHQRMPYPNLDVLRASRHHPQ